MGVAEARQLVELLQAVGSAAKRLHTVLDSEARELQKKCGKQARAAERGAIVARGNLQIGASAASRISEREVQLAQDRAVAVGTVLEDAQQEETRLLALMQDVEIGNLLLADVRLPSRVAQILEQLQGCLASIHRSA